MKINIKIISLAVLASVSLSMPIYAKPGQSQNQGQNQGQGGPGYNSQQTQGPIDQTQQTNSCLLEPDSNSVISPEVESQLQFMAEEEKLARDVYTYLNTIWNQNVFSNIAKAEQMHMDSVVKFIEAYNISNLALDNDGDFTNSDLQALYDSLIEKGSSSLIDALMVGALIEEVDIKDLIDTIAQSNDIAIIQMYTNLLNGSYSHLRAFVSQLESQGVSYSSQGVLTQQQIDDILTGTNTQPTMNTAKSIDATGSPISSSSCFINQVSRNSQIVGNNAEFASTDNIQLSSIIKVNSSDQGKNARLVSVAGYTTESGESVSYMRDNDAWKAWDGNINTLSYAQQTSLAAQQNFDIFNGTLGQLKGQYVISVAYVLDDGSIVYNAEPIRFSVID